MPLLAKLVAKFLFGIPLADKRAQKTSVRRFQNIRYAGIADLCQPCCVYAALRSAPRVEALCHRAFLDGHQTGCLRAGDTQGMHRLCVIQAEQAGRARCGDKHASRSLIVESARKHAALARKANAYADLVAGNERSDELLPIIVADGFSYIQCDRARE